MHVRKRCAIVRADRLVALARQPHQREVMAAVFALVFLFVLASSGLLVKVMLGDGAWTSGFALVAFLALAWGMFIGLFKLARRWENEPGS